MGLAPIYKLRGLTSFFVLLAVLLCGCSSGYFTGGRGDAGQFILQQAVARGGSPITTNALPVISGRWRYSEDKDGVVIRLSREQYPAVEAFLRQAFGEPKMKPTDTLDGGKLGVYRLSSRGGAIQFGCDTQWTQVIVIRPVSLTEIFQGMAKAAKAMGNSK